MKKTLLFTLALATICILPSCHKAPEPSKNISFGNYTGMSVKTHSQEDLIHQGQSTLLYPIDFVSDNNQAEYILYIYPDNLSESSFTSFLYRNNDLAELQGDIITKTIYQHKDSISEQTDSLFYYHYYCYYSCEKMAEDDELSYTEDSPIINANDSNDQLSINDSFINANRPLLYTTNNVVIDGWETGNDSIELYHVYHDYNCYMFPSGEEKYIGVKVTQDGKEFLGWIKLLIHPNGMVDLLETAIQK